MKDEAYFAKLKAGHIAPGHKFCSKCMNVVPLADFYTSRSTGKPYAYCIECSKAQSAARPGRSHKEVDSLGRQRHFKDMYQM